MSDSIKSLLIFLLALAGLLFSFSIVYAGIYSLQPHTAGEKFPDFFANAFIIIGGVLSTNLGAVLGVTLTPPQAPPAVALHIHHATFLGLRSSFRPKMLPVAAAASTGTDKDQKLQIIACWFYIIGLVTGTLFWTIATIRKIPDESMVPLIVELTRTLLGVIAGALVVALGQNRP